MSQPLADSFRGLNCIVVNSAWRIAPWALALVANDVKFWNHYPEAWNFAGRKFSTNKIPGLERVVHPMIEDTTSSAVLAAFVAIEIFGADEIELHGVDNHAENGSHFHGDHPAPLQNPGPKQFARFAGQWAAIGTWAKEKGARIANKTPGSALTCFET